MSRTRERIGIMEQLTAPLQKVTPDQAMQAAGPLVMLLTVVICAHRSNMCLP